MLCSPTLPEGPRRAPTCEHPLWQGRGGGRVQGQSGPVQRAPPPAFLPSSFVLAYLRWLGRWGLPNQPWPAGLGQSPWVSCLCAPYALLMRSLCTPCTLIPHTFCTFSLLSLKCPASHFPLIIKSNQLHLLCKACPDYSHMFDRKFLPTLGSHNNLSWSHELKLTFTEHLLYAEPSVSCLDPHCYRPHVPLFTAWWGCGRKGYRLVSLFLEHWLHYSRPKSWWRRLVVPLNQLVLRIKNLRFETELY